MELFSLDKRRLLWDITEPSVPEEGCRRPGEEFCTRAWVDRTRKNDFQLEESRFRLDIRTKFFTVGMVRHRTRLPREVVGDCFLEMFKSCRIKPWATWFSGKCPKTWQGGWREIWELPSSPNHSITLWFSKNNCGFPVFQNNQGNSHSTEINLSQWTVLYSLFCAAGHKKGKHASSFSEADLNLFKCGY